MLSISFPQLQYIHSSASTSDSDEQGCNKAGDLLKNKKLKNELCRNYLNNGYCRYYDKCQFAHGIEELRQSCKTNIKYKTKQCQSYFVKGCCQYGQRCNFQHFRKIEQVQMSERSKYLKEKSKQMIQKSRQMRRNFGEIILGLSNESKLLKMLQM